MTGFRSALREDGQASVETVACAAAVVIVGLVGFHLLAAGYAAVMADQSAQAAASAVLNGSPPGDAARAAVPGWPEQKLTVRNAGDRITVTLEPPSPLRMLGDRLAVTGEAALPAAVEAR